MVSREEIVRSLHAQKSPLVCGATRVFILHICSTYLFDSSSGIPFEGFGLYCVLSADRYPRDEIVPRLQELAAAEVDALRGELSAPEAVRMHSVGVDA